MHESSVVFVRRALRLSPVETVRGEGFPEVKGGHAMMRLYQREECSDSKPVREKLTELGMTYIAVNVPKEKENRREVFEASGQYFIPVLIDGDVVIANDPAAIVRYLSERYGGT